MNKCSFLLGNLSNLSLSVLSPLSCFVVAEVKVIQQQFVYVRIADLGDFAFGLVNNLRT